MRLAPTVSSFLNIFFIFDKPSSFCPFKFVSIKVKFIQLYKDLNVTRINQCNAFNFIKFILKNNNNKKKPRAVGDQSPSLYLYRVQELHLHHLLLKRLLRESYNDVLHEFRQICDLFHTIV